MNSGVRDDSTASRLNVPAPTRKRSPNPEAGPQPSAADTASACASGTSRKLPRKGDSSDNSPAPDNTASDSTPCTCRHFQPSAPSARGEHIEQMRLATSALAPEDHGRGIARSRPGQQVSKPGQLGVATNGTWQARSRLPVRGGHSSDCIRHGLGEAVIRGRAASTLVAGGLVRGPTGLDSDDLRCRRQFRETAMQMIGDPEPNGLWHQPHIEQIRAVP